jgi:hypothetical protein
LQAAEIVASITPIGLIEIAFARQVQHGILQVKLGGAGLAARHVDVEALIAQLREVNLGAF